MVIYVKDLDKSDKLEILEKYIEMCTIIFVDVQSEAIELWKELFKKGFSCCLLYGQMDQEDRIDNLEDFKKGTKNILVTTSICARGLDVPRCGFVINFRCPNHMEDYIHRIGRTGRAGKKEFHILLLILMKKTYMQKILLKFWKYQIKKYQMN